MSGSITSSLARHARGRADTPAVIEVGPGGTRRSLTFAELDTASRRWAATLARLGVGTGEPVAYQLPNVLDFVAISLGTMMLGAVCEPLMPIFRERELEFMLGASATRVLIVPGTFRGHDHLAMARGLHAQLPDLRHVVCLDDAPAEAPSAPPPSDPRPELTAQLLFTSGSTGEPKGVLQTHRALQQAALIHTRHFRLTAKDVIYVPSPLAHQTGFLYGMWIALALGATQVIQTTWEPEIAFDAMAQTGVSFVQAATPFLADLVRVAQTRERTLPALKTFVATGAAIPRELAREARAALGAEVGGAFGTTESCLGAAFVPGEDPERAWSTDGRALEDITLRVTDDDGNTLPAGAEGNFEVLTPTLFEGYLNRPELTAQALTPDGYYRTGDLARIDADGYLHITGRVKDVINRGGEKVPVVEVEQVLYAHPSVREVAIVAMADERLGERACAFVVLEPDGELDFEAMQRHLDAQHVAKPYWPERLELVDELPHTPSGKIQKFLLREALALERKAIAK
ncbi:AMP-binding protein [Conexibacter sp. S30A1]|uniref:AMP-binding protein n=1 Tax=Conexibacter sp. S30A1 TaxID=2937800 RepID=UPI00200D5D38|nr:AMP-binding protein [Conexibacter sp. S30A1]